MRPGVGGDEEVGEFSEEGLGGVVGRDLLEVFGGFDFYHVVYWTPNRFVVYLFKVDFSKCV